MTDLDDLRAEIAARPDDDAPRTVYADELLRRGDPRGELINLELELARAPTGELARRRFELRATHADAWWGLGPWQVTTRRGFVERVTLHRFAALPAWLAREHVEEVQLLVLRTTPLDRVLADPAFQHVRRLILVNATVRWLPTLLASPLADRLESLELVNCETERGRSAYDAFPALRHVRCSGLVQSHHWLAPWRGIEQLETLAIPGCRVDERLLDRLRGARGLESIDLSGVTYDDERRRAIVAALPGSPQVASVGCGAETEEQIEAVLDRVEVRAPTGEYWRFERRAEEWAVFVDGVAQSIVHYRQGHVQPARETAPIGQTVTRLAMGGGRCGLAVGDATLAWSLHGREQPGLVGDRDYCSIASTVGSALRVLDPRANELSQ